MLINTADVAELMHLEERKIIRWIQKEGLNAVNVNGVFQINRVDLLEWAAEHDVSIPPELVGAQDQSLGYPSLSEALAVGGVYHGIEGDNWHSVLKNLVANLHLPAQIDREFLLQVLLSRKTLGAVAIGDGIAIPHVRSPILVNLPSPAITLTFLKKPVDFGARDRKPVGIIFMLASPTMRIHLHLLSILTYALQDDAFRAILRPTEDPKRILEASARLQPGLARR